MPPEILAVAFEPLFTTKEPGKGTGLGLASVYRFAKKCGGVAVIESELRKGTTVTIYLPRARNDATTEIGDSRLGNSADLAARSDVIGT